MKKISYVAIVIAVFAGVTIWASSCKKPTPPKAIVNVIDEAGNPVSGAMVVVKAPNADNTHTVIYLLNETKHVADTQYTDDDGRTYYDFKYEAVYRVEVTKGTDRQHPLKRRGIGVLELQEDKTIKPIIKINEQTIF